MKYASDVIDLLAAYPGRRFKMRQILNHVAPRAMQRQLAVARTGVWRALCAEESGQVCIARPEGKNGSYAEYWWKTITSDASQAFQKPRQYLRAIAP
ncbi:hypothetical protein D7I39_11315 [Allopusillimonas ginsengisoli]|nr:hypothetical protein D7I39_11315 [Allopusillimonas ginsengisoli]